MPRYATLALATALVTGALAPPGLSTISATPARAEAPPDEARVAACKRAMNERIQVCTDDCTHRALAAASNYQDTNNNVKFGCLKGCALGQVFQMKVCRDGGAANLDPTETNH